MWKLELVGSIGKVVPSNIFLGLANEQVSKLHDCLRLRWWHLPDMGFEKPEGNLPSFAEDIWLQMMILILVDDRYN